MSTTVLHSRAAPSLKYSPSSGVCKDGSPFESTRIWRGAGAGTAEAAEGAPGEDTEGAPPVNNKVA